ncbi:MAG: hypothetical protein WD602_03965 [Actinomycetota bacterium]
MQDPNNSKTKAKGSGSKGGAGTTASSSPRGGTAGILAGVAVIAPVLIRELTTGTDPFLLLPVALVVLTVALAGFRKVQGGADGAVGRIGLIASAVGAVLLAVVFLFMAYLDMVKNTRLQNLMPLYLGAVLLVGGILVFGGASLKAGTLGRGATLLLMVSLPLGVILDLLGAFRGRGFRWGPDLVLGPETHLGIKVMGLALIWLGYSILTKSKQKVDTA